MACREYAGLGVYLFYCFYILSSVTIFFVFYLDVGGFEFITFPSNAIFFCLALVARYDSSNGADLGIPKFAIALFLYILFRDFQRIKTRLWRDIGPQ